MNRVSGLLRGCDLRMDVKDYEKMGMNMNCSVTPLPGRYDNDKSRKEGIC